MKNQNGKNATKDRIIIIQTGGTIGSTYYPDSKVLRPLVSTDIAKRILGDSLYGTLGKFQVEILAPFHFMSEDMIPSDWVQLAELISLEYMQGNLIGVVIMHGTDTLSYASTALSFTLSRLPIPVIITGASIPPDAPDSDAKANLNASLLLAVSFKTKPFCGTYVVFKDPALSGQPDSDQLNNNVNIYLGARFTDSFFKKHQHMEQVLLRPHGFIDEKTGEVTLSNVTERDYKTMKKDWTWNLAQQDMAIEKHVYYFSLYPGFDPIILKLLHEHIGEKEPAAFVLDFYHSGTICSRPDSMYNVMDTIEQIMLSEKRCMFLNQPQLRFETQTDGFVYSSEKKIKEFSTRTFEMKELTPEAALMKAKWILPKTGHPLVSPKTPDKIREYVSINVANEIPEINTEGKVHER
jgi:glutamyl-tRNA(Gln) amidotransferase subunit D